MVLIVVTGGLLLGRARLNEAHVALAYLLVVLGGSARGGRPLGFTLAGLAFLGFDWGFLPPYGTLTIGNPLDWLVLVAFLGTSLVAAQLLYRARAEAEVARQRAAEVDRLSALGAETLNAGRAEDALQAIAEVIRATLALDRCAIYTRDPEGGRIALASAAAIDDSETAHGAAGLVAWVAEHGTDAIERTDGTSRVGAAGADALRPHDGSEAAVAALVIPLRVRARTVGVLRVARAAGIALDSAQQRFLRALAYYAALGVERVRLIAEAERAEALREASRLKDAVIATVSHDLRTPLTTIKALAHDLALEPADVSERASVIEDEADRLNAFVANLLDLSRINSGSTRLVIEPNEAEDLIGAALQRVAGAVGERTVRVTLDAEHPLLFGMFDFAQTLRALVNLIDNALKYSPPGSPVDVIAKRAGAWLAFSVADRGPGIPTAERERIFEPFYRRPGAAPDVGGAGLGLSIARGLAVAMGGSLEYEDREGGGSIFTLRVPALDVGEPSAE